METYFQIRIEGNESPETAVYSTQSDAELAAMSLADTTGKRVSLVKCLEAQSFGPWKARR